MVRILNMTINTNCMEMCHLLINKLTIHITHYIIYKQKQYKSIVKSIIAKTKGGHKMEEWVKLKDILETKPSFCRRYIDYVPDEKWTTSQTCENGHDWQYFETEYNLGGYHAFLYQEEIYLISVYATIATLKVKGENAYEGILSSIAKIHSIYGCEELQATGKPLTSRILKGMPKFLRECYKRPYWLCERVKPFPTEPGRKLLNHVITRGEIRTKKLLRDDSKNPEFRQFYSIRPLIHLPSATYVDIGSQKKQGTFKNQVFPISLNK